MPRREPRQWRCEVYVGDTPWEQCTPEQQERARERVARAFARVALDRHERERQAAGD